MLGFSSKQDATVSQLNEEEIMKIVEILKELYARHSLYPPDYFQKVKEVQQIYLVSFITGVM